MSHLQYGTLKYLLGHNVTMDRLGGYNLTTLGSLIKRGWVERRGNIVVVTEEGSEAYASYHNGGPNYRLHEGPLSERVRLMLHIRSLSVVKKTA